MKPRRLALILLLGLALALPAGPVRAEETSLSAKEILDKIDDLYRGQASHGRMSMAITTAHWTRTLELEFWSQGKDKSLIRILAPTKEKGTATLRVGSDLWNYLPKVKRVIKLPSSMMSASWMGSHFTNNDLVKESRMAEDYTFEVSFQGRRRGEDLIEVTCLPKPEAAVVWGKVLVEVRLSDYQPLLLTYFDEVMKPARTMTFAEYKTLGGRLLPARMTIVPADKPEEKTVVEYQTIEFEPELAPEVFSLRNLQR